MDVAGNKPEKGDTQIKPPVEIVNPGASLFAIFAWMSPKIGKGDVVGNFHAGLTGSGELWQASRSPGC